MAALLLPASQPTQSIVLVSIQAMLSSHCNDMQAEMLEHLAGLSVTGIPQVVEHGTLPGDVSYIITKPLGALLAIHDTASLIVSVITETAAIIHQLASLDIPVLHRDISIGNIIYHGDACMAYLIDFGTAVKAPTGCFTAVTKHSITGTSTYMARSVLEGGTYTVSSELESLMYVMAFLAVSGNAHWANKPVGAAALAFKVQSFSEQRSFETYVVQRCRLDMVKVVRGLRDLFWLPTYQHGVTAAQFQSVLRGLA